MESLNNKRNGKHFCQNPFGSADFPQLAARLARLDESCGTSQLEPPCVLGKATPEEISQAEHYDVVLMGGGLSLIYAPLLARNNLRVAVVERLEIARAHREWNASYKELLVLVNSGLVSEKKLNELIVARYRAGRCRWAKGDETQVQDVLDCAVDAQGLLDTLLEAARAAGVSIFEHTDVQSVRDADDALLVRAKTRDDGAPKLLHAKAVIEGRGASSPWARGDLVCPTVGGVLTGLIEGTAPDEVDRTLGDILVTTEDVDEGRQHIWEAFPTAPGEVAVYLFYYAERHALTQRPLAELYARFWRTLPQFKRGPAKLVRPTFGIIPGWSRLTKGPSSPHKRLVLVGDAASRHSPLTFCGFGATLRSLGPGVMRVTDLVRHGDKFASVRRHDAPGVEDRPLHKITGALALMMARADVHSDKRALNKLLNAAFNTLSEMPNDAYGRLLRDEMAPTEVMQFMWRTSRSYPAVWKLVGRGLGVQRMMRWLIGVAA